MSAALNISSIKKAYFIGIGGIGMSALARFFAQQGAVVMGYDRTETALTKTLVQEGIQVHYNDDPSNCPADVDMVVYTPAIPAENRIISHLRAQQVPLLKRSDVLGIISAGTYNICIAGTHGKTTTSAMVAHVLRDSGYGCNAFLGGISSNYQTNFWSHPKPVAVIEADEYDRSFLKLHPDVISISSMDPDHLDIYGTSEAMESAFIQFSHNLKENGLLLTKKGLKREADFEAQDHLTYALHEDGAAVHVPQCSIVDGAYRYDVVAPHWQLKDIELNMGGRHNVENSLVAIAIAKHLGIDDEKIMSAIASFKGVKRRFEYVLKADRILIDDYAHHPEELRVLLNGVRELYPERKITIVFQPHLYSRTRDLVDGFAQALDLADETWLLPIYPAREEPLPGVSSQMIADRMKSGVRMIRMDELENTLQSCPVDLLITAGAGDIDKMTEPLKNIMMNA